jgi:hypothetical protein
MISKLDGTPYVPPTNITQELHFSLSTSNMGTIQTLYCANEQQIQKKIKTGKHRTAESVLIEQFQQKCVLQQPGVLKKICFVFKNV